MYMYMAKSEFKSKSYNYSFIFYDYQIFHNKYAGMMSMVAHIGMFHALLEIAKNGEKAVSENDSSL